MKTLGYNISIIPLGNIYFDNDVGSDCALFRISPKCFCTIYYEFSRFFCHQIPSRCFWLWDSNLGTCSRCFSTYVSFSFCRNKRSNAKSKYTNIIGNNSKSNR
ncbi:MAG: DUF2085 domain-containing protein [Candidatus Loosdrechtia sp.]|uniref:DUF2085 domain-containing protein n=1 Tax=Candidatus Loosdrechtia sp. TaxID=3101272 RepID=UPI00403AA7F4